MNEATREASLCLLQPDTSLGTDSRASQYKHTEDIASLRTAGTEMRANVAKPAMVKPYFKVQIIF